MWRPCSVLQPIVYHEGVGNMKTCTNNADVLTPAEKIALAIIRVGRSFVEAAEISNVPVKRVMEMWGMATANSDHQRNLPESGSLPAARS